MQDRRMTGLPMLLLGVAMITTSAFAITVEPQEMARKDDWVKKHLLSDKGSMPFSFKYGGRASADLLPSWERKTAKGRLDDRRTEHVLTWTDGKTGLQVRCQAEMGTAPVCVTSSSKDILSIFARPFSL